MSEDSQSEPIDVPEMSEPKNSFQSWFFGIAGTLIAAGIIALVGQAVHLGKIDTILDAQVEQTKERKAEYEKLSAKIDGLPKAEVLTPQFAAMTAAIAANTASTRANDDKVTALSAVVHDNRVTADSKYESLQSEIKMYGVRQWGVYNMDRWVNAAEKKLGKPLPSTQEITGREPGQP